MDENNSLAVIPAGKGGVQLNTFEDMWRFSKMVVASGMAPKGFDKPEAVMFALQMSMELGISPIQGLQNIAVINQRAGIFGDAALALVRASGLCESYSQELTGEGDTRKAIVRSKRGGIEIVNEFSVADAKRAQLWGKSGPWSLYPDRMLIFRARGFNLRDNFGDVLKGFRTTEELADIPEERATTGRVVEPTFTGQNARLTQPPADAIAREKALERLAEMKKAVVPEKAAPEPESNRSAAEEVIERLAAAEIHQQDFLRLLDELAIIEADGEAIEYGHFTIGHIPESTLQMVLGEWATIIPRLKGVPA